MIAAWGVWRGGRLGAVVAGLALGWSVVVEHQAVLAGSAIGLWALIRWRGSPARWPMLAGFLAGGIAALLPLLAYNLVAFGTPFRLGYQGVVGGEGMRQGLFGLTMPRPDVLAAILVGDQRGLVWVAPILLFAPFGLVRLIGARRARGLGWAAAATVAIGLLVNAAYVYWDGGNSTGPRLAMPVVGMLALGLAPLWLTAGRADRIVAGVMLALSVALNAAIASAEVLASPEYHWPIWNAVIELRFLPGDLRTWPSEWWGWTPWQGFQLWAVLALPLAGWLAWRVARA